MAALPSHRVYQGLWIDHMHGEVLGATMTTTSTKSNLIIAVLSLLVAFAGAHLWDLIAFVSYVKRVSRLPRPAYHHQRMALTRNITSPGAFVSEIVKLAWSWRHEGIWLALCLEAVLALICSVGFLLAGIFVSLVVSSSNLKVLVRADACGHLSWRNETTTQHQEYQLSAFNQAVTYSDTCYNETTDLPQCNIYVQQRLAIRDATYTDCPFPNLCTNHSALRLDSGLLDSNEMFGINSDPKFGVQMQRVVTCAPLDHTPFFAVRPMPLDFLDRYENQRPALFGEQLYEWFMGQLTVDTRPFNSTVWQSSYLPMFSTFYYLTPRVFYVLGNDTTNGDWYNSTFVPIPALRRKDADTHLIAIQNNGVHFYNPNEDPLFAAHKKIQVMFDNGEFRTMYTGDNPATFLGCKEQMRFCFARGECTPLDGVLSAFTQARRMAPTARQNATLYYLFLQTPTFYNVGRAPMQVTRNAVSFQAGIPPNQWEFEVRAWFQFLLAFTQTTITHLAAGPGIVRPDYDQLAEPLPWPGLCGNQRMGAPDGYSNVNVVGFTFVVAFSGLIILTNISLVPILKYLDRRGRLRFRHVRMWVHDGMLQVQRRAYQGVGYDEWTNLEATVPLYGKDALLPGSGDGVLPVRRARSEGIENRDSQQQQQQQQQHQQASPVAPLLPPVQCLSEITLSAYNVRSAEGSLFHDSSTPSLTASMIDAR